MDTSVVNILMCEKAKEIQNGFSVSGLTFWKHELIFHDYVASFEDIWEQVNNTTKKLQEKYIVRQLSEKDVTCYIGNMPSFGNKYIWLPRQDQLQEMIPDTCVYLEYFVPNSDAPAWSISRMSEYPNEFMHFNTAEKAWLAFVMKEKFNKVWDGEDWTPAQV